MQDLWTRLERFFAGQGWPVVLRPGASEAEINQVEQVLGLRFPDDLRASLYIHDGENWQEGIRWLDNSMILLPVTEILAHWNLEQKYYARWGEDEYADDYQDEGRIRNVIFHPRRIPIAAADADVTLWLDFTPGPEGIEGQVIMDITECDFLVLASNYRAYLARYVELLEAGIYFYEEKTYQQVIPQNLDALHSGAVRQDDFYRQLFPLVTGKKDIES